MASIPLSKTVVAAVKKSLHREFPGVRSSHLTEALATALGHQTHAALLNRVDQNQNDPPIVLLDDERFALRLQELGYEADTEFSFEFLNVTELISTAPSSAFGIQYRSARDRAWRNLIVCAINEGIRQKYFSVRPGDNRWPGAHSTGPRRRDEGQLFDFMLPCGLLARAFVHDAGFQELAVNAAVNPKGELVKAFNGDFYAGDAFACSWLERKTGAWLQSARSTFKCRKLLLPLLSGMTVHPLGFGDRGKVIM